MDETKELSHLIQLKKSKSGIPSDDNQLNLLSSHSLPCYAIFYKRQMVFLIFLLNKPFLQGPFSERLVVCSYLFGALTIALKFICTRANLRILDMIFVLS